MSAPKTSPSLFSARLRLLLCAAVLLLAGCRRGAGETDVPASTPTRTAAAATPAATSTPDEGQSETAYPGPGGGLPGPVVPTENAYPGPAEEPGQATLPPGGGYPPPESLQPTPAATQVSPAASATLSPPETPDPYLPPPTSGAYPDPNQPQATPQLPPTLAATPGGETYPGPGESPALPTTTIPVPGTGSPPVVTPTRQLTTPLPDATGTLFPGEPTSTPQFFLPTSTPLGFVVFTGFRPTDPESVDLASGKFQLVEFYARWSPISQSMAPVVHALEARYGERMNFVYLDVDDKRTRTLQAELGYTLITRPHFYLIDGVGNIMNEWVGYVPQSELEEAINQLLPPPDGNG